MFFSMRFASFLVVVGFAISSIAGYPVQNDPVIWGDSSTTTGSRTLTSQFLGECVCDVTRGMCDANCCCDPDCSEATRASFEVCVPDQYGYPDIRYCYEENSGTSIRRINNIDDVFLDKARQAYPAVCIIRANHPGNLYKYFSFPTSTQRPQPPLSNTIQAAKSLALTVGGPVPIAKYVDVGGETVFRGIGNFQIPIQQANGQCSGFTRNVGFLNPLQGVSCVLNGEQICRLFPVEQLVNLFAYRALPNQSGLELIPIHLNILDSTGDLLGTVNASDLTYDGAFNSVNDGTACLNSITAFSAEFVYNTTNESAVVSGVINVTTNSVPVASFVPLTFEVAFVELGTTLPQTIIPATPGYVAGGSIRAGTLVSSNPDNATIVERKGGFAVPSGGRSCALQRFRSIAFMHSVKSAGCTVTLSEAELMDICSNGNSALILGAINSTYADGYPSVLDYVAVTNDALSNDTSSWTKIQGIDSLQFAAGSYDPVTRQCSNMAVGLSYQFVIARAGAEYNPQDLILGAFVEPLIGSWRIRNSTDLSSTGTSSQNLVLRVSFSRYDPDSQATIRRRVRAPPILPRLDDSIFYPFRKPYPL